MSFYNYPIEAHQFTTKSDGMWEFRPEPMHYQRYLLQDLAEDLNSGHNVRSTVFIEVKARYRSDGPEEMRPVGEVTFVEGLATESASLDIS
jgi:hypothetical protein